MKAEKQQQLERHGWRVGSAEELLGLSPEEAALVQLRLKLADAVKDRRTEQRLSQVQLAKLLGSSQSRVAKVEAADQSVSLDLLARSFFATGGTMRDLARVLRGGH